MSARDYQVLGLGTDATLEDVRRAFKTLALRLHPDKNKSKDATKKFQELNAAYAAIVRRRDSSDSLSETILTDRADSTYDPEDGTFGSDTRRSWFSEAEVEEDGEESQRSGGQEGEGDEGEGVEQMEEDGEETEEIGSENEEEDGDEGMERMEEDGEETEEEDDDDEGMEQREEAGSESEGEDEDVEVERIGEVGSENDEEGERQEWEELDVDVDEPVDNIADEIGDTMNQLFKVNDSTRKIMGIRTKKQFVLGNDGSSTFYRILERLWRVTNLFRLHKGLHTGKVVAKTGKTEEPKIRAANGRVHITLPKNNPANLEQAMRQVISITRIAYEHLQEQHHEHFESALARFIETEQ